MSDTSLCDDKTKNDKYIDVSIIIPIYNGEKWISRCFESILKQTALNHDVNIELSIYDDSSRDDTEALLNKWKEKFTTDKLSYVVRKNPRNHPGGVGHAKNAAIKASSGEYLCFQDIDDVMLEDRIWKQLEAAKEHPISLIGSKFLRDPPESTKRYTRWANELEQSRLSTQIYTSHGPTIIMPTWFCHRDIFERVGGFSEEGKGVPEDLIFFYEHLVQGGTLYRVDEYLLIYTYHPEATTFSVSSDYIFEVRFKHLEQNFFHRCKEGFTVWNAGKQGRHFLRRLSDEQRNLVRALCDVDVNKIGTLYEMYSDELRKVVAKIPIVHFKKATPPFVICMKMDMTDGEFENNLKSLNLREGIDYVLFG